MMNLSNQPNTGGIMKKLFALLMVSVIMGTMFAGCSKNEPTKEQTDSVDNTTTTDGSSETETMTEVTNVTVWYYWEAEGHQKTLNKVIDDFNTLQKGVSVEAKYVPFTDFKKQLSIGASADELPDIVILDNPDHAAYASMGIFADITGEFDVSNYYAGPVNSATIDGKLYGVPFGSNCLALFYNDDMLQAAGVEVPTTWEELEAVAAATTTDNVYGLAFSSLQNEEGTFNFLPWVWSTGASSYEINSEGGIKALKFIKGLVDAGSMPVEAINWTQGDTKNQFISGNLAMMINGTWQVPSMRSDVPDMNWNVAMIPQDKEQASGLGGENFAVIAGGQEEASLEFLKYVTQPEVNLFMMNNMGYISPNMATADGQFGDDSVYQVFVDELEFAKSRGPLPEWPQVSDAISLAFNEVIVDISSPEVAAEKAQKTIDSIIGQ
jgi:multiple sugar transport system substrate-binding protein